MTPGPSLLLTKDMASLWALVTTNRTHSHRQAEAPVPDLQRDQKMPQGHFLEQVLHTDWLPTHLLEV